jgi:hypothetical protein
MRMCAGGLNTADAAGIREWELLRHRRVGTARGEDSLTLNRSGLVRAAVRKKRRFSEHEFCL